MQKCAKLRDSKNFENSLTTVKVMTKTKVAPFYLGHGVVPIYKKGDKRNHLITDL